MSEYVLLCVVRFLVRHHSYGHKGLLLWFRTYPDFRQQFPGICFAEINRTGFPVAVNCVTVIVEVLRCQLHDFAISSTTQYITIGIAHGSYFSAGVDIPCIGSVVENKCLVPAPDVILLVVVVIVAEAFAEIERTESIIDSLGDDSCLTFIDRQVGRVRRCIMPFVQVIAVKRER